MSATASVVAGLLSHLDVVTQRDGCVKLRLIAQGSVTCAQAVADAGGAAAVVAALQAYPDVVGVQEDGCYALASIAKGSAVCTRVVGTLAARQWLWR